MKSLKQYVQKDSALDRLRISAAKLEALTRRIRATLPADARPHIAGCAPRPDTLVVLVDSAAWATQLRYLQDDVLAVCRQELGRRILRVQFKVMLSAAVPGSAGNPPVPDLPENTRRLLRGAAAGIADDELAAALRRLSETGQDAD